MHLVEGGGGGRLKNEGKNKDTLPRQLHRIDCSIKRRKVVFPLAELKQKKIKNNVPSVETPVRNRNFFARPRRVLVLEERQSQSDAMHGQKNGVSQAHPIKAGKG